MESRMPLEEPVGERVPRREEEARRDQGRRRTSGKTGLWDCECQGSRRLGKGYGTGDVPTASRRKSTIEDGNGGYAATVVGMVGGVSGASTVSRTVGEAKLERVRYTRNGTLVVVVVVGVVVVVVDCR